MALNNYSIVDYPGYFGKKRDQKHAEYDKKYSDNWKLAHEVNGRILEFDEAILLYDDAYYHHLRSSKETLDWIVRAASEVYDNAPSNVKSGVDYNKQENGSNHYQDISVRRALIRLGTWFKGNHLVQIRGPESEGYRLQPGQVPFHIPELIRQPRKEGWWKAGTIEDFWQANKVLVIENDRTWGCRF